MRLAWCYLMEGVLVGCFKQDVFKEITRAYETLKDPSKRQIYDLGTSNPEFNEAASEEDYSRYYEEQRGAAQRRSYWQNKWNGFKKPQNCEDDLRDVFENHAKNQRVAEEWAWKAVIIKLGVIAGVFVVFDALRYYRTQKHKQLIDLKKEILVAQFQDNSSTIDEEGNTLNDYISVRIAQIEQEDSGFEEQEEK